MTTTYTLTNENAADLLTAASIRDMLNGHGGIPLTDTTREQHLEQLGEIKGNIPADIARAAWAAVATREPNAKAATAMLAWLREQNVTN